MDSLMYVLSRGCWQPMDSRSHLWYCEVVDRRDDPTQPASLQVPASLQLGFHLRDVDGHLPARDCLCMGKKSIRTSYVPYLQHRGLPGGSAGRMRAQALRHRARRCCANRTGLVHLGQKGSIMSRGTRRASVASDRVASCRTVARAGHTTYLSQSWSLLLMYAQQLCMDQYSQTERYENYPGTVRSLENL